MNAVYRNLSFAVAAFLLALPSASAQEKERSVHTAAVETDIMTAQSRGEYIVKRVAMCIECHTPRDEHGNLIQSKLLNGAPIPVNAPPGIERFAANAPNITGMMSYTEEEGVHFLMTGLRPDGTYPHPPMPPFRMIEEDARAVVRYLKSLK